MLTALKYTVLSGIGLCLLLLLLAVDTASDLNVSSSTQVDQADRMNLLLKQVRGALSQRYRDHTITVTADQAVSLAGFAQRALKHAQADVSFKQDHATLMASYQIRPLGIALYLNIQMDLLSGEGVRLERVKVGSLSIPGGWAMGIAKYLSNQYTQSEVATKALESVRRVDISSNGAIVYVNPLDALLREFKQIKTGSSDEDDRLLKIKIAHYLRLLDNIDSIAALTDNSPSLSIYLHALMTEAKALSTDNSATLENEAAMLALAIFAGHRRFSTLVGDLSFAIDTVPSTRNRIVLQGRQDLALHFIFSAAIKLLSEQGISIAVGEFKELMDRGQGGSGYSFVDLAADMAGTHFASLGANPSSAKALQKIMAGVPTTKGSERFFFPSIDALDEGMNAQEFTDKYQAVDSPAYLQAVNTINERIDALPISQAQGEKL